MTFAPVHPARRPRHAVLMLAVTATLTSATVQAQQAGATSAQTTELDRVQVLGSYASSLERALNDKRYAPSVIDSIEAEDIGKLPAQNVAEAL